MPPMFDGIYAREFYLNKIRGFYRDDMIKVITGVRRCGKSSFIKSVANDLEASGVPAKNIIYMDLDSKQYLKITTPDDLVMARAIVDSRGDYYANRTWV